MNTSLYLNNTYSLETISNFLCIKKNFPLFPSSLPELLQNQWWIFPNSTENLLIFSLLLFIIYTNYSTYFMTSTIAQISFLFLLLFELSIHCIYRKINAIFDF